MMPIMMQLLILVTAVTVSWMSVLVIRAIVSSFKKAGADLDQVMYWDAYVHGYQAAKEDRAQRDQERRRQGK